MDWAATPSEVCSIARAVAVFGDRWSVLVLRDLSNGLRRFDTLVQHLGVARDVLSRRLETLTAEGIVERVPYAEVGQRTRYEYRLTDKGRDLTVVLIALKSWGDKYLDWPAGPPLELRHADCGAPVSATLRCAAGHDVPPVRAMRPALNEAALRG